MRKKIKTNSGKTIELPARMFRVEELEKMDLEFVEEQIFFNLAKKLDEDFKKLSPNTSSNMGVVDYPDCSNTPFSEEKLKFAVMKQINSKHSDSLVLPYFKNESSYDVRRKIELASELKLRTQKEIILEISYKEEIPMEELVQEKDSIDALAIFWGQHYGQYPGFLKICRKILDWRILAGKRVYCTAVPLKFAGENPSDVVFMPCFYLIADAWVKNWKRGGGNKKKVKVIDKKDFRSKEYTGWLENGYTSGSMVHSVNRTVFELFNRADSSVRAEYESALLDEVFNEIRKLTPDTVENYVYEKFNPKYSALVIRMYREKILLYLFREEEAFNHFNKEDKELLEKKIREQHSPKSVSLEVQQIKNLLLTDRNLTARALVTHIDGLREKE